MNGKELLELGFIDTSYNEDGIDFREHTFTTEDFTIEIDGINSVEIRFNLEWVYVPNCKTIDDLKQLIRLFKNK